MKILKVFVITVALLTSACAPGSSGRAPLGLQNPEPLSMRPVKWIVIPSDDKGPHPDGTSVIFGLSEAGYKNLAENIRNIINFIGLQRKVIDSYQKYYEQSQTTPSRIR